MVPDKQNYDSRLMEAYQLLRSIIEGKSPDNIFPDVQRHLQFSPAPPTGAHGVMSATDLLSWWFRAPLNIPNPWDVYFDRSYQSFDTPRPVNLPNANKSKDETNLRLPLSAEPALWENLRALIPEPGFHLDDSDAEKVVDCLYEFLHAVGRCDIDSAMQRVADDYHVFEADKEIDRLGLRHRLESLLDSLRGWEIEISLVEVPEPIFCPNGILIHVEIQIDANHQEDNQTKSIVEERIAVFRKQKEGEWKIFALSAIKNTTHESNT